MSRGSNGKGSGPSTRSPGKSGGEDLLAVLAYAARLARVKQITPGA